MGMEKKADGYWIVRESRSVSDGCVANLVIDKIDGDFLDTQVNLNCQFWVAGNTRNVFLDKLSELIEEYRI